MRISVVLLCYNHERFVEQALESIRHQSLRPAQLIVTDDASTDGSAALVRRWLSANWPDAGGRSRSSSSRTTGSKTSRPGRACATGASA